VDYAGLEDTVNEHAWQLGMEVMEDQGVEVLNNKREFGGLVTVTRVMSQKTTK